MDISNLVIIKSNETRIQTTEKPVENINEQASIKAKPIAIDEQFADKSTISNAKEIPATVINKLDNGKYLLELVNGKQLEIKLPAELKALDKVFLQLDNSKIVGLQVKDIATSVSLNSNALAKLINNLQQQNIKQGQMPLLIDSLKAMPQNITNQQNTLPLLLPAIKLPLPNIPNIASINNTQTNIAHTIQPSLTSSIKIIPVADKQAPILQTNNNPQINLANQSINFTLNGQKQTMPIAKIEFPQPTLQTLINSLQNNKTDNLAKGFEAKVSQQPAPNILNVSLSKTLNAEIILKNSEPKILNNFISFKPTFNANNNFNLVKADNNNPVQTIKLTTDNFKQIIEPLKSQIILKNSENIQNFTANIQVKENTITLPSLNNLTIKSPVNLIQLLPQANQQIKADLNIQQLNGQINIELKAPNLNIKLDNIELVLNTPQTNTAVNSMLQNSSVITNTNNTITLKSPDFFEIILNVKNNISDNKNIQFSLSNNSTVQVNYLEKTIENPTVQVNQAITKQALPNLAEQFAPQLSLMLAAALIASKQSTTNIENKDNIFTLLLDSIPEQYQPKLQASSQQNEPWKLFSFPYYQEENQQKNGQALYSRKKNEQDDDISNLAIKVNFSNIGDVMLKFQTHNKNITLNIYTQIDIKPAEKQQLVEVAQQAIEKSGFFGTVSLKKQQTIEIPLLNSEKIVYSGMDIKV